MATLGLAYAAHHAQGSYHTMVLGKPYHTKVLTKAYHTIPMMESIRNVHGPMNLYYKSMYYSMKKPIKWAVKNSANGINWTLNFVNMSHGQAQGCSNSWTMQPLKDTKFPFINHALYWSGPNWMLANANARFGHHQPFRQLFLNTTIIHKAHPITHDTNNMISSDSDNTQCCHCVQ